MVSTQIQTDLDKTIEAVNDARVIVGHTLSTIGFQGDPMRLVIEELQFALRPAAVTFAYNGLERSNIIDVHFDLLSTRKASGTLVRGVDYETWYRHYNFVELQQADTSQPLLRCLLGVNHAHEFRLNGAMLTIYHGGSAEESLSVGLSDSRLRSAVWSFFQSCLRYLSITPKLNRLGDASIPLEVKIPKLAGKSYFLRLVLKELRDQILEQLDSTAGEELVSSRQSKFTIQFFLLIETPEGEIEKYGGKHLRYFPLDDELKQLRSLNEKLSKLVEINSPDEFILNYAWTAEQSLIGYTFDSQASRFFSNWQTEPVVDWRRSTEPEQPDRRTATLIMQELRENTLHQFNIPLFALGKRFGAIIVNTHTNFNWEIQRIPVRCARQVGSMIDAALEMDPEVNESTRKIAAARAYKHMLSALLHEERSYCRQLGHIYESIYHPTQDNPISHWEPVLRHVIADRTQLTDEFELSPPVADGFDPIRHAHPNTIFHNTTMHTDCAEIQLSLDALKLIFGAASYLDIKVAVEPTLENLPAVKTIVLRRILGNLLRNTLKEASHISAPVLRIRMGLVIEDSRQFLEIIAQDNCGGFCDGFPRGQIDFDIWNQYLDQREHAKAVIGGMGFLTLLKYTSSTGGTLYAHNITLDGQSGAEVVLRIGMPLEIVT